MRARSTPLNLGLFQFAADFAAIVTAYYATVMIRFHSAWGHGLFASLNELLGDHRVAAAGDVTFETFYIVSAPRIVLFLLIALCGSYALLDLYPGRRFIRPRPLAWNVVLANAFVLVLFYVYFYIQRNIFHPRSFFATMLILNTVFCVTYRLGMARFLDLLRDRFQMDRCPAVLIGTKEAAGFLEVLISELHPHGIRIAERISPVADESFVDLVKRVEEAVERSDAQLIISADTEFSVRDTMRLLALTERLDIPVKVLSEELRVLKQSARQPVDTVRGIPLIHFGAPSASRTLRRLRHGFAFLIAAGGAVLLLPLAAVIAVLVRVTSRGPFIFVQERIGVDRNPFRIYKFRTMYHRADEEQAEIEELNESGEGLFKIRKDPRITPVGRFLRRFSLDELPQLLNVLKGDMTIVGPRPLPRRDFENYYEDWHYSRHSGKPGLTCLWQVSGRSEIDFHNMCILDVYYLRNQGWVMDIKIAAKTIWAVLFAKGAY